MSFIRYATDDSVISSETIVRGMWRTGSDQSSLTQFFTSSVNTSSYYLNVYDTLATSSLQFTLQYGHLNGSGSADINVSVSDITPTRITYGQYRSLIYNDENASFVFSNLTSKDFYAINIARSRFKESIKPGSLHLKLTGSTTPNAGMPVLELTDSSVISGSLTSFIGSNRYYTLISGSLGVAATTQLQGVSGSYGLMFPDLGIILLNPSALSTPSSSGGIALSPNTTNGISGNPNLMSLFRSISGSNGSLFKLQSQETVSSRYFFTRVKNSEFNYTTNPSIINNSGSLLYDTLIDNPQSFVTTVGMYNDNNELLAVAKLSRPLVKDFTKEALIRIKLDY
jgi:hypothetical protein